MYPSSLIQGLSGCPYLTPSMCFFLYISRKTQIWTFSFTPSFEFLTVNKNHLLTWLVPNIPFLTPIYQPSYLCSVKSCSLSPQHSLSLSGRHHRNPWGNNISRNHTPNQGLRNFSWNSPLPKVSGTQNVRSPKKWRITSAIKSNKITPSNNHHQRKLKYSP